MKRGHSFGVKTEPIIRVSVARHKPFVEAQEMYEKWSKIPFFVDLSDYISTGCVVSNPLVFAMGKIVDLAKEGGPKKPAWFIRCAVGDIRYLLTLLPCYLDTLCFCRRSEDKMRVYDMKRFVRLVESTTRSKYGRISQRG